MAKIKDDKILKSVITFLNLQDTSKIDSLLKKKNELMKDEGCGLMWIILYLVKNINSFLLGTNNEEETLVRQWLEYASIHLSHLSSSFPNYVHSILMEISEVLSDRVFLLGNKITIADLIFYYMMYSTVNKLTFIEKEQFIHVSRWFNHMQQDKRIRQSKALLTFSCNLLYP